MCEIKIKPYEGYIEKLKEPIELKGRVIRYKPVAKLSGKSGAKKGGMKGGNYEPIFSYEFKCSTEIRNSNYEREDWEKILAQQTKNLKDFCENKDTKGIFRFFDSFSHQKDDKISGETGISFKNYKEAKKTYEYEYDEIIKKLINLIKDIKKIFDEFGYIPYEEFKLVIPELNNSSNSSNNPNSSNNSNSSNISKYSYNQFLTYLHQELEKE